MKSYSRIVFIFTLVNYFLIIFHPLRSDENFITNDPIEDNFILNSDQFNNYPSQTNHNSNIEIKFAKDCKARRIFINPTFQFYCLAQAEFYQLHNVLQYNLPYICYKFPLSEHTEEG